MAYAAPNATPYQSNLYPIASRFETVKRGDGSTAGGGTATTVGTYLFENLSFTRPSKVIDRTGIYGQGKGEPTIVREPQKGSGKCQIDLATTNMIHVGDYFEDIIDVDAGAVSANKVRFIISDVTLDNTAGVPNTFNISVVEDYIHSSQYGGS
jgi:hypothetical protein